MNNLAGLLEATNRLAEAEPLYRRVVQIFWTLQVATGRQHPNFNAALGNYASFLMQHHNLSQDQAVARIRGELGIGE